MVPIIFGHWEEFLTRENWEGLCFNSTSKTPGDSRLEIKACQQWWMYDGNDEHGERNKVFSFPQPYLLKGEGRNDVGLIFTKAWFTRVVRSENENTTNDENVAFCHGEARGRSETLTTAIDQLKRQMKMRIGDYRYLKAIFWATRSKWAVLLYFNCYPKCERCPRKSMARQHSSHQTDNTSCLSWAWQPHKVVPTLFHNHSRVHAHVH